MITIRTLLSGGDLFGVGARQAGYTHLDGYELDPKIAAVARLNGFDVRTADICQVDYASLPDADHLHASPVCTRASTANVGAEESDADSAMADAICRAIASHKGATVSIENVWAYREFDSFKRICAALTTAGFVYDFRHLNSADYGVPQTRKRLILRAVRGRDRVPGLRPTHSTRGGILLERWNGWYAAIEDLIPTLPETQPAPWQLARMPKELRASMLIGAGGWQDGVTSVAPADPCFTITASDNHAQIRAFLGASNSGPRSWGDNTRTDDEPAHTVTLNAEGRTRTYIVGGGNTQFEQENKSHARADTEPMFTISAGDGAKKSAAAWLIDGCHARTRAADEPATTLLADDGSSRVGQRAYISGRWVRMSIRALGRFQTVPDNYIGLTPQVNGNGVPVLLARRIMESLRGCHA